MEQKNWHIVHQTVGYHRHDTSGEFDLLNRIWELQRLLTNHFGPQQKLISKGRTGANVIKKYGQPAIPYMRVLADKSTVAKTVKTALQKENKPLNPAGVQRQIQAVADELLTLMTANLGPKTGPSTRALSHDSSGSQFESIKDFASLFVAQDINNHGGSASQHWTKDRYRQTGTWVRPWDGWFPPKVWTRPPDGIVDKGVWHLTGRIVPRWVRA